MRAARQPDPTTHCLPQEVVAGTLRLPRLSRRNGQPVDRARNQQAGARTPHRRPSDQRPAIAIVTPSPNGTSPLVGSRSTRPPTPNCLAHPPDRPPRAFRISGWPSHCAIRNTVAFHPSAARPIPARSAQRCRCGKPGPTAERTERPPATWKIPPRPQPPQTKPFPFSTRPLPHGTTGPRCQRATQRHHPPPRKATTNDEEDAGGGIPQTVTHTGRRGWGRNPWIPPPPLCSAPGSSPAFHRGGTSHASGPLDRPEVLPHRALLVAATLRQDRSKSLRRKLLLLR